MAERSHLSIGEVLSLLQEEFPDVTISKIRFLESQGLVDPERTPSGYRKFYDHDVERLRWILRQQRENFLPLKVIKDKLSEREIDSPASYEMPDRSSGARVGGDERVAEPEGQTPQGATGGGSDRARAAHTPSLFADLHKRREEIAGVDSRPSAPAPSSPEGDAGGSYTVEELARTSGADVSLIEELRQFGLIAQESSNGPTQYFDESAVAVARAAAEFSRHGVEVRHLRVWRNSADREADLFQQIVMPLLRQRNPQARREALDTIDELSRAGASLRDALLNRALREVR